MNSTTAPTGVATPRLERPRDGRMVAGVAAGLARHLNIDPTLVRLGFVVGTFVGGFGVLAYVAGALLVPDEGEAEPVLRSARLSKNTGLVAGVVLLLVGGLMAMDSVFDGHVFGHAFWTVGFLAAGAWLLLRSPGDTAPVSEAIAETRVAGPPESPAPPPRRSRRGTRVVGGVMLLVAGLVSGALAVTGADLAWQEAAGIAVIAAGATLAVGGMFGASPWLIVPPLAVAASVAALGAAGVELEGPVGERHHAPALASQLPDEYRVAIGELDVDLRDVRFPPGTTELRAQVGMGELTVRVPAGVRVQIDGHAGAGEVRLPGGTSDGTDVDRTEIIAAPEGAPLLVLDAEVGFGELTVEHEEAR